MGYSGKLTCPRCGRVLVGIQPCPNCTAGGYSESYQAYGQGVSAPTVGPRLVLLLGAVLLLSLLVFLVAPRGGSPPASVASQRSDAREDSPTRTIPLAQGVTAEKTDVGAKGEPAGQPDFPLPNVAARGKNAPTPKAPTPANDLTAAEEEEFWRKKLERDLRDVGEYTPTAEEKAYLEQMRWQEHFSLSNQTRTSDYFLRRPEFTGSRR